MFNNILIICVGNICRSPTGERLMQSFFPQKMIHSVGFMAPLNKPADNNAIRIAKNHNLSLEGHYSRRLTEPLCQSADLILVMENHHIQKLYQQFPQTRGKVMLFGEWLNKSEIPDPYKHSDEMFEHVYQLMEQAASSWQGKI
ncbi:MULTISPECIES: arsenate reductase/protein-tyrosine-phosphatase family protein [Providencia]|uniref:arsenate reductase/protein-tyrosine-phosphatase family protein n=1 Tax=Providencia TaxID=586 RepID=UPI0012B5E800|nr:MULTISPECIES: protein tyrosine phosphatase [Providencia]